MVLIHPWDAAVVAVDAAPCCRMLTGIHGIRLTVLRVDAKFTYDDHNPAEHRHVSRRVTGAAATGWTPRPRRSDGGASS